MNNNNFEYVGFWPRFGAMLIDSLLLVVISIPLFIALGLFVVATPFLPDWVGMALYILISWVFPITAVIMFWVRKQATPGKMAISSRIVDAETGDPMTVKQAIIRYLSYILSSIPLGLGYLWVCWDPKKQAWHDKIAGTVVVRASSLPVK